jgi:uncharacterized protein YprB with RNaseH-like and TPR domain
MSDLRARLRNLRAATRPAPRYYEPEPPTPLGGEPAPLEVLAPGELHETPFGTSYIVRTQHTHDHVHGEAMLNGWLAQSLAGAAVFTQDQRLATIDPRRCLFLDTETTGLNAGSGTLVFLVGVGLFTDDGFEVRQYFLRDPGEEPAMLHALRDLMDAHEALITFNGRSFDIPMLVARYTMNRQRFGQDRWPNLDLLHPARRLWKRRLESCRLSALESAILGVQRDGQDVPGFLIPQLYHEYLQTGDARQMRRVIYHNLFDVLSMVTLATYLCQTFTRADTQTLPYDDVISLARWYERLQLIEQAEAVYLSALNAARHDYDRKYCLESLAALYKRLDRHVEAEPLWQAVATICPNDPSPCIELAKYHEWTTGKLEQALTWTEAAQLANVTRLRSFDQQTMQAEIEKRRARLLQKLSRL